MSRFEGVSDEQLDRTIAHSRFLKAQDRAAQDMLLNEEQRAFLSQNVERLRAPLDELSTGPRQQIITVPPPSWRRCGAPFRTRRRPGTRHL